jgi:hypothetical protein
MAMSGRKVATLRQKKRISDFSDDEGTVDPSCSKKAQVSAIAPIPPLLISKPELMDTIFSGKAWTLEKIVETRCQILYKLESDQSDFELY